jgi:hypothetical protein
MTELAMGLPQALDDGPVASQTMDSEKNWLITCEQDDALVFSLAPSGTVSLRAVRQVEWDAILAANEVSGRTQAVADVVRHVVSEGNVSSAEPSKTRRSFRERAE